MWTREDFKSMQARRAEFSGERLVEESFYDFQRWVREFRNAHVRDNRKRLATLDAARATCAAWQAQYVETLKDAPVAKALGEAILADILRGRGEKAPVVSDVEAPVGDTPSTPDTKVQVVPLPAKSIALTDAERIANLDNAVSALREWCKAKCFRISIPSASTLIRMTYRHAEIESCVQKIKRMAAIRGTFSEDTQMGRENRACFDDLCANAFEAILDVESPARSERQQQARAEYIAVLDGIHDFFVQSGYEGTRMEFFGTNSRAPWLTLSREEFAAKITGLTEFARNRGEFATAGFAGDDHLVAKRNHEDWRGLMGSLLRCYRDYHAATPERQPARMQG